MADQQPGQPSLPTRIKKLASSEAVSKQYLVDPAPATRAIHADDVLNGPGQTDVAPPLHVATTFRYTDDLSKLVPLTAKDFDPTNPTHVYSRLTTPNSTRLEALLTSLLTAPTLTYASGLAAFHALLTSIRPRIIAIGTGYHGCHGVIALFTKLYGLQKVDLDDIAAWDAANLGAGDIVHVETPLNPSGEAVDLAHYAELARKRGALLTVDATFAPPPLQNPFNYQGVHAVLHSGTKYIGGHSDMLCGVLSTRDTERFKNLFTERVFLGSVMGNMEGWLGVRSVRTLELRVQRQSENARRLVAWLADAQRDDVNDEGKVSNSEGDTERGKIDTTILATPSERLLTRSTLHSITHASLQAHSLSSAASSNWLTTQMPSGFGPVFSITLLRPEQARALPANLEYFHHATSLGGVESLVEWRRMTDPGVDERLIRISVGIENWEDLKADLVGALRVVKDL